MTAHDRRQALLPAGLVFVGSTLAQAALFDRALVPMDEGHLAAAASWLLDGEHLYRDIHTGIFPLIYYLAAALFAVFGEDLLVLRIAQVFVNAATATLLFAIARRGLRLPWAVAVAALHAGLVVWSFPVLAMLNYSTFSIAAGLAALLVALRYLEHGRLRDGLVLGLAIAVSALTKQNFGALVFVAIALLGLWCRRESALAERPVFGAAWPIAAGGLAITGVVVLHFVWRGDLGQLLDSTVLALGGSQMADFDNPIPPIFGPHPADDGRFIFLYSPPPVFDALIHGKPLLGLPVTPGLRSFFTRATYGGAFALMIAAALLFFWPGGADEEVSQRTTPREHARRAIVLFPIVFFPGIFPSAIWSHLAFVLIPLLLLAGFVGDTLELRARAASPGLGKAFAGGAIGLGALALVACVGVVIQTRGFNPEPMRTARATLSVSPRLASLTEGAVAFFERCGAPGEPIFVAPDLPVVYFLTDRPNPTPYDLTIPGNVDGALIVRRLEASKVGCALYSPRIYPEFPPFPKLFPQLAAYLASHYDKRTVIRGGDTEWWGLVRKGRGPGDAS